MYGEEYEHTQEHYAEDLPKEEPAVISTSQAVNLTSTLASLSALFALFLCFADQRSHAVHRFSVQSAGLGVLHLAVGMACWILGAVLGWIPVLGYYLYMLMVVAFLAASALVLVLRVRMMLHAYRGQAYALPVVGQALRRFE